MADEDEDLSQLRAPNVEDNDDAEDSQEFGSWTKLIAVEAADRSLPKRGEKDFESHATNLQLETLEASRRAMHGVLSWQRTHTQKNHILAMYDPESNMACVDKVKSQHFQTMGTPRGGKEWLLPEEALFLIERGTLDCRWPVKREVGDHDEYRTADGAPMSLQSAYAAFIGFEGGVGGKLTLEMYNVYAGLKRSGYVVFRTGSWNEDRGDLLQQDETMHAQSKPGPNIFTRFFSDIWQRLSQPMHTLTTHDLAFGPIIKPGLYRSYTDIYRLLKLIPTHDRTAPPTFLLPPSPSNPFRVHFDVYRTTAKFRKSARGPPDFRICVIDARTTPVPTGAQLNDLFAQVPEDRPKASDQPYQKLKHGYRNVVLAVVDNGMPSYIRLADSPFEEVKIYERAGPRGKGGRGRGRGRGGRGRGRGR
ncbi:tRNA splicing endonuclease-like protein subunit, partial [Plenodomus tracheiphilus IPT5]